MKIIYTFWTGDNPMPAIRQESLASMRENSGVEVLLIENHDLDRFFKPFGISIHPAYMNLNLAHRADYLRAFFMHHYGGGYCDIKSINQSWLPFFEKIDKSDFLYAVGYKEKNRHHVANTHQSAKIIGATKTKIMTSYLKWRFLQCCYRMVVGNGAFIVKPMTPLTYEWWNELNDRMNYLSKSLAENPAKYPKERCGHSYDGEISRYPVPWSYLLGDIWHPLTLKYALHINKTLPPPDFTRYQ